MRRFARSVGIAAILAALVASPSSGQLVPQVSVPNVGLPSGVGSGPGGVMTGPVGGVVNDVGRTVGGVAGITGDALNTTTQQVEVARSEIERELESNLNQLGYSVWAYKAPPATLLDLRKMRLAELVKNSGGRLEMDGAGNPTVKGRLVALGPTRAEIALARRAGFSVIASESEPMLGTTLVVFSSPAGMTIASAMSRLREAAPTLNLEFDHIYEPAGGALAASSIALAAGAAKVAQHRPLIGMIDGGVAQNPALRAATIEQKGFVGTPQATGHGTAVASLIVGSNGKFRGAAPHASLLVADVYGGDPAAGSALAIVKALSWLTAKRPSVINVSLVGPRNRVVERAVSAVQARGIKVVAAVGNDGPAAPPLYPASQAGVIAVTGVDAKNRALPEAGRVSQLDYAAPGADMAAALPGDGYASVRGTSFAAPFVAARLAVSGSMARLDAEASKKGHGRIGRGIVCGDCRVSPKVVRAK